MTKPVIVLRHLGENKDAALDCATQIMAAFPEKRIATFASDHKDAALTRETLNRVLNQNITVTPVLGESAKDSRAVINLLTEKEAQKAEIVLFVTHLNLCCNLGRALAKEYRFSIMPELCNRKPGEWYFVSPIERRVVSSDEMLTVLTACAL